MKYLFILLIFLFAQQTISTTQWEKWNSGRWNPTWSYNPYWQPGTPSGWSRNVNHPSNPDSNFYFRDNQYMWKSKNGMKKFCGPEGYLSSNGMFCERNPQYWNPSLDTMCYPNTANPSFTCTPQNNPFQSIMPCCFISDRTDITNPYTTTTLILDPDVLNL